MNYLFLDNGFEEIEAITTIDLLRRAKIALTTVSITGNPMVLGAHNIAVEADGLLERIDFSDAEMLILPGGQTKLGECSALCELLVEHSIVFTVSRNAVRNNYDTVARSDRELAALLDAIRINVSITNHIPKATAIIYLIVGDLSHLGARYMVDPRVSHMRPGKPEAIRLLAQNLHDRSSRAIFGCRIYCNQISIRLIDKFRKVIT